MYIVQQYFIKCECILNLNFLIFIPYKNRLPFNWQTPFGYALGFVYAVLVGYIVLSCIVPTICFSIGCVLLTKICFKNAINDLNIFYEKIHENSDQLKQFFCDIVQDLSDLKQLNYKYHANFFCYS